MKLTTTITVFKSGSDLAAARKKRRISLRKLASLMDCSLAKICRIEKSEDLHKCVTVDFMKKLIEVLDAEDEV